MPKKAIFFFSSFASSEATAPLGLLAVATPLQRVGYSIQLIDSTIIPNSKKRVLEEEGRSAPEHFACDRADGSRDRGNGARGKGVGYGFSDDLRGLASLAASEANA
jgi:hypothetical protein